MLRKGVADIRLHLRLCNEINVAFQRQTIKKKISACNTHHFAYLLRIVRAATANPNGAPMARKIKRDDNSRIIPGELRALFDSASEQAAKAAEFTAEHGNILRNGLERFGVDRTAFTLARKLYKMEESRREGTLRDLIKLCSLLGFFDQRSAFEDVYAALMEQIGAPKAAN
jgi:hypothetical protein